MRIQTMSIVVGEKVCNAKCPFCISDCTPEMGLVPSIDINWRNFDIACQLAEISGVTTCLLTGKGEPTLYHNSITTYLEKLQKYKIPFKELQTNGIMIYKGLKTLKCKQQNDGKWITTDVDALKYWYDLGLTTICLSMVSQDSDINKKIYQPNLNNGFMSVPFVVGEIKDRGLMVRLSCMLLNNYIDSPSKLENLIVFCKEMGVRQLTIRPITSPSNINNEKTKWIIEHTLSRNQIDNIQNYLKTNGTPILELAHGATVYDVGGQNVCWSTCLTTNKNAEDIRQIIYFPDGTISHSWQYSGAIFL